MSTQRNLSISLCGIVLLLLVGCQTQLTDQTATMSDITPDKVGSDRDEHNCIASAGYTWSVLKGNCVKLFEEGIRLSPTRKDSNSAEISAFVIFSEDESEAEVYLPELTTSLLLHRHGEEDDYHWEKEGLRLFQKEELVLMKGDRIVFTGE